jgi:hypothetical protein
MERLIRDTPPSFPTLHIEEPKLIFAGDRRTEDPKTGITLFGPRQLDRLSRSSIRVAVIGTGETIQLLQNWLTIAERRITTGRNKRGKAYDAVLAPDFPGFFDGPPFCCKRDCDARLCETLSQKDIDRAIEADTYSSRVSRVVNLVADRLSALSDKEPSPDVVVCAMPEVVDLACCPQGKRGQVRAGPLTLRRRVQRKLERKAARTGQLLLGLPQRFIRSATTCLQAASTRPEPLRSPASRSARRAAP